ncbi:MAG: hypothetical protein JW715_15200 [Sedimentisphaerales bacterium]|nr:hypothetical protein [Sedimentisphaerales bacterium]
MTKEIVTSLRPEFILSLTPTQRWNAARFLDIGFMGERWFVMACVAVLIVLAVLFIIVTYCRIRKEREFTNRLFFEYSDERGLSPRERHILMYIATKAKLKQKESIFTMANAFDRGATKINRAALTIKGQDKRRRLNAELSVLREKLGFQKRSSVSVDTLIANRPGSRQIPADRTVYITALETGDFINVESFVIENNDLEFIIEPSIRLEIGSGELLCVRCYFGASIWEFDTTVIGRIGDNLILEHNDNIRFVNRRRFLRVPINRPAYIAAFPFSQTLPDNIGKESQADSANSIGVNWGLPKFVRADVTELAGPGLRMVAPLEVKIGDRVVVILKLGDNKNRGTIKSTKNAPPDSIFAGNEDNEAVRIVEDIGMVRHAEAVQNGFSIAVELTGLSEMNLSELVRATNAASLKARFEMQFLDTPADNKGRIKARETVAV